MSVSDIRGLTYLDQLYATLRLLQEDFNDASERVLAEHSNSAMRSFLRAFWALVDGSTYAMRKVALEVHCKNQCFTQGEASILRGVVYDLNRRGGVTERDMHLDTIGAIRFTFHTFRKAFALAVEVDYSDSGWQAFQHCLSIRHRVVHPKSVEDLTISPTDNGEGKDVDLMVEGGYWFISQFAALMKAARER